ncbi:MAG: leucine-rich repeat domain-containing protein, partial [Caryophanon sp.]|nr:leucine-rich repeat domain-containing protein [Caryophanon sp.]
MNKWLATFATIAAVCVVTPQAQAAEEVNVGEIISEDGVNYRIVVGESGNKEAEVIGTTSLTNRAHVNIAEYVKGIVVTSIAPSAFSVSMSESDDMTYDDIQSVTLPNTLKKIGSFAFYRTSISSITLPNGLEEIGESAFAQTNLQAVIIPNTVKTIGSKAFYGAAISTLTIPNSVQSLGSYIMSGELGKVELKLPEHFTTQKGSLFEHVYYEEFTHNGKKEVRINGYDRTKKLETITIPETINGAPVTEIGAYSFQRESFIDYEGLEAAHHVMMPTTIRKVGDYAFQGLAGNTFNISEYTNLQHIGTKAFERNGITNSEPFVVTKDMYIGEHAFLYNRLTSVIIEDGVTHVRGAFRYNKLTTITLPASVTHIGDEAFGNNDITSVQMPPNVEKIGKHSFVDNKLEEVVLPDSVTDIGEQAFASNNIRTPITIRATQTVGDEAFMDNQIPAVTIEEGVTELPMRIFQSNQLTDVQLPSTLTGLGVEAFANNELTDVFIPHLSSYGSGIFADNPITSATFEEGMTYIPEAMLMSTNLQHVELPSTV